MKLKWQKMRRPQKNDIVGMINDFSMVLSTTPFIQLTDQHPIENVQTKIWPIKNVWQ